MPALSELEALPVAVDHTSGEGPLSPSLTMGPGMAPLQLEPEQAAQLGYMPLRDDFERVRGIRGSERVGIRDSERRWLWSGPGQERGWFLANLNG